jgi:hypothetical protein
MLQVPEVRLAAYQRFVRQHIDSVLYKNYTTLADLVGDETWRKIRDGYFAHHPADDYELNASVRHFPGYVSDLARAGALGLTSFHAELAEFERHEFEVYSAPVEIPAPRGAPLLNPTLAILQFEYPIGAFVRSFRAAQSAEKERPAVPSQKIAETVFVMRHPRSLRHVFAVANPALLIAFKIAHDHIPPQAAASEAQLPIEEVMAALQLAEREGLVVLE